MVQGRPRTEGMNSRSKLTVCEYQGRCDAKGNAVGHAPKVLSEYVSYVRDDFDVTVYAPETILKASELKGIKRKVLNDFIVMEGNSSFFSRIFNKFRMFRNISSALKYSEADKIWFFNTEFYLMLYLALFGNRGKEIYITTFMEGFLAGKNGPFAKIKQKIFEKAQKKIKLIISAGPAFSFKNAPSVFIPDYACDPAVFDIPEGHVPEDADIAEFVADHKKDGFAVCLGTMNPEKQLEEMTEAFKCTGYPLLIAGRFYDPERLTALKKSAGRETLVKNTYLSKEDYAWLLKNAFMVVLPYAKDQYSAQTSGVMQEAVFAGTPVMAYEEVLLGNRVPGIGIRSFDSLKESFKAPSEADTQALKESYSELRRTRYSREIIKKSLIKALS